MSAAVLLLDQTRAFDRVHRSFLWEVLTRFGVDESFHSVDEVALCFRGQFPHCQQSIGKRFPRLPLVSNVVHSSCLPSPWRRA